MKDGKDLKKEIVLKIKESSYTVKFPDSGVFIDLEGQKARIPVPNANTSSALWAYNLAIAIETLRLLVPNLQADLNVKDFYKLSLIESRELVEVYLKTLKPWMEEWLEVVTDIFGDDENDSKDA